jgi:hypothetical protein
VVQGEKPFVVLVHQQSYSISAQTIPRRRPSFYLCVSSNHVNLLHLDAFNTANHKSTGLFSPSWLQDCTSLHACMMTFGTCKGQKLA